MSKILRVSDRIKLKIADITFTIAPLNQMQKIEVSECTKIGPEGKEVFDLLRAQTLLIKYSLKEVEGVEDEHGEPYQLSFENDSLSDDCVTEIFTLEEKHLLTTAAWQCLNGLPDKLTDPINGKKLKGVALELVGKKKVSD